MKFTHTLLPRVAGVTRRAQDAQESLVEPRRIQERHEAPRRAQDRRTQESPGEPRRAQKSPGGPKRAQQSPGEPKRAQANKTLRNICVLPSKVVRASLGLKRERSDPDEPTRLRIKMKGQNPVCDGRGGGDFIYKE